MSKHWTEKTWREHIENRRRNSTLWQFIHMLGSLHLAMVLLITIPVACAVATFYESKFTSQVAQAYVYKSPWFLFWLAVLCINLFAVTLTRWPWRRRHIGFVITHYGIIILLVGAAVGQKLGFEASVTLHTTHEPTSQLVINRTILQVQDDSGPMAYTIPLPVETSRPTEKRPRAFPLLDGSLELVIDQYAEELDEATELIDSPLPGGGAGVALELHSSMMAQSVPVNLVAIPAELSKNDFFGRAQMEIVAALPDRSGTEPPEKAFRETQMVFERFEPVITARELGGAARLSGIKVALVFDREAEGSPGHVLVQTASGHREVFELEQSIGRPITLHDDGTRLLIKEFWPDMELKDGKPVTLSRELKNPVILITLENDGTEEKPLLEIAPDPAVEKGILWQMSRGGYVYASGKAVEGEEFSLGWADWAAKINKTSVNAMLKPRITPAEPGSGGGSVMGMAAERAPGVRGYLVNRSTGARGEPAWIPSGRGVTLRVGERTAFVGFGLAVFKLPFTVQLLSFEVPLNEGTNKPSDYRSIVRFDDRINGKSAESLVHMNHPASFPEGFWRVVMGTNYKFSQANWNPKDLNETTLQVLHDPGWPLKWVGSLLICVGITIMFYIKPGGSGKKESKATRSPRPPATTSL